MIVFKLSVKFVVFLFAHIVVWCLGAIFYDRYYLRGRWFNNFFSEGWLWATKDIWHRIFFQTNTSVRWPVSPDIRCGTNIIFEPDDLNNFMGMGNYFQTFDAKIIIGKGSYIAANVGIITSNHDLYDLDKHQEGKDVIIGEKCWIGMNSIILPGVILGERTIVGAGSVVTKSFLEGNCIIAGNPARIVRRLSCIPYGEES